MPRYTNDHVSCAHLTPVTIAITILRSITASSSLVVVNKATVVDATSIIVAIGECLERLDAHGSIATSHIDQ